MSEITKEELESLNKIQNQYSSILMSIGVLEIRKQKLLIDHDKIQEEFTVTTNKLKSKYGEGIIDLNTGEIKPEKSVL